MISYGTRKRRRPLVSLREHGRRTKISKENKQADKEDNENVTVNVEDTETTDKEHRREIDNENMAHYRPMNRICVDAIGPIDIDNQKIKPNSILGKNDFITSIIINNGII